MPAKFASRQSDLRLKIEFILLFIVAPILMAVSFPPSQMIPALFGFSLVGLGLLYFTDGFSWRDLWAGWGHVTMPVVAVFALCVAAASFGVMLLFAPESMFEILREHPALLLLIFLLYPLVSALPQELLFRVLYYRRYGRILPKRGRLALNAAVFSLAHLLYWSWVVALFTMAGGLVFAWAYEEKRSFPLTVVLHAIAGNLLFLFGMGIYFYSGNVTRPF